jgi:glutathione S-transferase
MPESAPMKLSQPIRFYRNPISGHCHRVELYLTLLDLPFEPIHVDFKAREHKQPAFLRKNVFGQLPVVEDGDVTLADSTAIMLYLGERYDTEGRFWPRTPEGKAAVQRWLSVASGPLAFGPGAARRLRLFAGSERDHESAVAVALPLLATLDAELTMRTHLVGSTVSVADLALYAYVARAPEGDISLEPYPAIRAWLARVEALPGFVPMPWVEKPAGTTTPR